MEIVSTGSAPSFPSQRNQQDLLASHLIGIGATRVEERFLAIAHQIETTPVQFEASESVAGAGVLFLLPFLEQTGLFSFHNHYHELAKGYYYIDFIVLLFYFWHSCTCEESKTLKS